MEVGRSAEAPAYFLVLLLQLAATCDIAKTKAHSRRTSSAQHSSRLAVTLTVHHEQQMAQPGSPLTWLKLTLQSGRLLPVRQLLQLAQSQRLIWIGILQKLPGEALGLVQDAAVVPRQGMQGKGLAAVGVGVGGGGRV